jgi:hypothetical protein
MPCLARPSRTGVEICPGIRPGMFRSAGAECDGRHGKTLRAAQTALCGAKKRREPEQAQQRQTAGVHGASCAANNWTGMSCSCRRAG